MKKYFSIKEINESIKLIDGSNTDYISVSGNVYKEYKNNMFFAKKITINKEHHYSQCGITLRDRNKVFRVHRLVAKAFIPNPNNYPVVGHKDNDKNNNVVTNLYWTTVQENTQKAFDDGLAINSKGYDDSQSFPVVVYDTNMNKLNEYGSVSMCAKDLKVSKSTVLRHCNHEIKGKSRTGYIFRFKTQ